ncbi:MAG: epoxyqueuosine reductase QueH [Lentisphaeria bacterium]|nr:epoxyqueuosine reductase QueH [Lentisphaeria bacterium]
MSESKPPHLLLHVCCGPCATSSVERLQEEGRVTLFYSNSNIWPSEEYEKRLVEVRRLGEMTDCDLVVDTYDHEAWLDRIRGLEGEPEKGARCLRCFEFSLARAVQHACANGFDGLATTLTVSPHKRSADLFRIGQALWDRFLAIDFKKQNGFARSLELCRQYGMYRQSYCGCEFSMRREPSRE